GGRTAVLGPLPSLPTPPGAPAGRHRGGHRPSSGLALRFLGPHAHRSPSIITRPPACSTRQPLLPHHDPAPRAVAAVRPLADRGPPAASRPCPLRPKPASCRGSSLYTTWQHSPSRDRRSSHAFRTRSRRGTPRPLRPGLVAAHARRRSRPGAGAGGPGLHGG